MLLLAFVLVLLFATAVAAEPVRIMPLGNSITRGGGSTGEVGYRRPLYQLLDQAGYQVDFVGSLVHGTPADFDNQHEGHGGYRADQLRDTVTWWLDVNPAEIILLHIGINDIAQGNEDPQEVYDLLDSIDVWEAANHPVTVVVASRIVLRWDGNDPETIAFNDSVETLIQVRQAAGDDLIAIDMEHALNYPEDLRDGVHPNDIGYQKMANEWFAALQPILPEPDTLSQLTTVDDVHVTATTPENADADTLECQYSLTGISTRGVVSWQRNGDPLAHVQAPFEGGEDYAAYTLPSGTEAFVPGGNPAWDSLQGFESSGAYVFDGDDNLHLNGGFPVGDSYSLLVKVKPTAIDGRIVGSSLSIGGFGIQIDASGHLSAGHNGHWSAVSDTSPMTLDEWHCVGLTFAYETGQISLYRDGFLVDDTVLALSDRVISDSSITLGSFDDVYYFRGVIDELHVFDEVLPPGFVAMHSERGEAWMSPDLTAPGETWRAFVTPFSGRSKGDSVVSNGVSIGTPLPWVSDVAIAADSPDTLETDNLDCSYVLQGSSITAAVAWECDGDPVMELYLPMEGGAEDGARDFSGNDQSVLSISEPEWRADEGHDGFGAFYLGGTAYLDAGNVLPTQGSYTKSAWVYRTGDGSSNILSGDVATGGHVFFASTSSQNGALAAGHNGTFNIVRDSEPLTDSVWYFAAVTFDYETGEMVLYRDGVEVDRDTATATQREIVDPRVYVGAFAASSQWIGYIDDARVYDHVLSPEQIQSLYTDSGTRVVAQETDGGEVWQATVVPFSSSVAGDPELSNSLTVLPAELSAPELITPVDSGTAFTLKPVFDWISSVSPIGGATIYYRLEVTPDQDFFFVATKDSLISPGFDWYDSLEIATQYWWTVTSWIDLDTAIVESYADTLSFFTWTPGDVDHSGGINIADLTTFVSYLFGGGDPIEPPLVADMNGDCGVNIADLTYLVTFLFQSGSAPVIGCQ